MPFTVEVVCRGVREYMRRTGRADQLKFSALNDAVSKALSGVPYAQAVVAERAGKKHRLNICPAVSATVAAIYGIDAHYLHTAIGFAAVCANQEEDADALEFWPFPERERALAQLTALMEAPINGKHVVLAAGDATWGTSTTIKELMRRNAQPGTSDGNAFGRPSNVAGTYLLLDCHYHASLVGLATSVLLDILDPPIESWLELPRGKASIAAAKEAVTDAGLERLLFDEFSAPLRSFKNDWRALHYCRGLERYVLESRVRALFECGRWQNRMAKVMPEVWANADVVMLDPIGDSPSLRAWLAANDPTQCVGEYDDAMVDGLLVATDGNLLLMRRYVRDAVFAVLIESQVKDVVRKRMRSLANLTELMKADCWAVSDLITGKNQER